MKQYWKLILTTSLLVLATIFVSTKIVNALNEYRAIKLEVAALLDFEERILTTKEWLPFSGESTRIIQQSDNLLEQAERKYEEAVYYSLYLFVTVLLYLLSIYFFCYLAADRNRIFGLALIMSSLTFIYLGLQTPFLELEAYNKDIVFKIPIDLGFYEHTFEKSFDGKVSYFYQNKSVVALIKLLFTGGNVLVGVALLLASVVFPLLKLSISFWYFVSPNKAFSEQLLHIIKGIGKWSMADVFVAGIFLAYFAFNNMNVGVATEANTLIGLYFYLSFVVLSICSGYFIKKKQT